MLGERVCEMTFPDAREIRVCRDGEREHATRGRSHLQAVRLERGGVERGLGAFGLLHV